VKIDGVEMSPTQAWLVRCGECTVAEIAEANAYIAEQSALHRDGKLSLAELIDRLRQHAVASAMARRGESVGSS